MQTSEAVPEIDGKPQDVKNWATSETVRARVKKEIIPMCESIRQQRRPLENLWARFEKAWTMEHELQSYLGRSNIYMPVTNKQVETLVGELVTATFPGDDFFSVEAEKPDWQRMAGDVKALEGQRVRSSKLRSYAEAFYRQMLIKGNSPARTGWWSKKKKGNLRKRAVSSVREMEQQMITGGDPHSFTYYEGPKMTPIPVESFYAWPENCSTLDETLVVFEDLHVPKTELLFAARNSGKYILEEVKASSAKHAQVQEADRQRLEAQELTGITEVAALPMVGITHCFLSMDPRSEKFEDDADPMDMCITFTADGHVLRVVDAESVCPGRCHPYVNGRAGTLVSRLWGTGFVERVYPLQLLVNDQMNQAMDSATYQLNPIIVSNPNLVIGTLPDLEPGVQWLVNDIVNAVKFDRPPDMTQSSSMLLTQTISFMQDFFGSPPVLQGGASPGRAFKTAAGVTTADKNAKTPLQQMVRLAEADVWEPVLQNYWLLDQKYASEKVLIEQGGLSLGGQKQEQTYADPMSMFGDYKFRWLASTQAANQQVMAQMLQQFIQIIIAPAVQQVLGQEGYRVQIHALIERIYRALGLRDVERVLLKVAEPQPGLPPIATDTAKPEGQPQQPMQMPQSPLAPLAGNAGQDPTGGFGEMRMAANQLASAFGGEGGMNNQPQIPGMMPGQEPPY